jgi:hypothetical protein
MVTSLCVLQALTALSDESSPSRDGGAVDRQTLLQARHTFLNTPSPSPSLPWPGQGSPSLPWPGQGSPSFPWPGQGSPSSPREEEQGEDTEPGPTPWIIVTRSTPQRDTPPTDTPPTDTPPITQGTPPPAQHSTLVLAAVLRGEELEQAETSGPSSTNCGGWGASLPPCPPAAVLP